YRPTAGKNVDPTYSHLCLHRFVDAAQDLASAWHPALERPPLPHYLPSFQVFVMDLLEWCEEVDEHMPSEDRAFKPVDFTDLAAVRSWLTVLRTQIDDVTAAGEDAHA